MPYLSYLRGKWLILSLLYALAVLYFVVAWILVATTDLCLPPWGIETRADGVEECSLG